MKPWLERALLAVAIVLVALTLAWHGLNWKCTRDLESARERWAERWPMDSGALRAAVVSANEVGERCVSALNRCFGWQFSETAQPAIQRAESLLATRAFQPQTWSATEAGHFAIYDDARFQDPLSEFASNIVLPECRIFRIHEGSSCPYIPGGSTILVPYMLEREVHRQFLAGHDKRACDIIVAAFALAAHLREAPTVEFCSESDMCLRRAVDMLRVCAAKGALDAALALRIQPWLARIRPEEDWLRAMDGERELFAGYAWAGLREGAPPNGVTHPLDTSGVLYSKLARPWRLMQDVKYFEVLEQKRALVQERPWESVKQPEVPASHSLARLLTTTRDIDGSSRLHVRRARDLAEIALRLVVEHADTGSCPESLAALRELPTEPPLGEPYAFSRTESGFTLGLSDPAQDPHRIHTWRVTWLSHR